jgi:adenylate cyclase
MESYTKLLEEALLQYVGSPVLKRLREDPASALKTSRQLVDSTILFTDIRSLNDLQTDIAIGQLLDDLNLYFETMSEAIVRNNGFVDSLIGDSIFAIFGLSNNRHAEDACNAAMECLRALDGLNINRDRRPKFEIGIGINSGKVFIGNVGSKHKLKFTAMGEAVNLASRMESLTKEYHQAIVLTEHTEQLLTKNFNTKELDRISVMGLDRPLIVYSLEG